MPPNEYEPRTANDFLRLLDQHRFHNPLVNTCQLCRGEQYRQSTTPTVRWSKAAKAFFQPPLPVVIMLGTIAVLICALALTMST